MEDIVAKADKYWVDTKNRDREGKIRLNTSQIRKFLTAVNSVANKVTIYKSENPGIAELSEDLVAEVKYLQVPLAYQAGRNPLIKYFVRDTQIDKMIKDIGNSVKGFEQFARYIEALVAYHKFYGGKDK